MEECRIAAKHKKARYLHSPVDEDHGFIFEKVMTKTDVSRHHQRLIIPKAAVSFFPSPGSMVQLVVPLMGTWVFEFNVWKEGRIHVIKRWHDFVVDNNLEVGHVVRFFRGNNSFEFTVVLIKPNPKPALLLKPSPIAIRLFGKWIEYYKNDQETEDETRVGKMEEENTRSSGSNSGAKGDNNCDSFLSLGLAAGNHGSGFTADEPSSSISASNSSTLQFQKSVDVKKVSFSCRAPYTSFSWDGS